MTGEHPAFPRYYALVERMQAHYGQRHVHRSRARGSHALRRVVARTFEIAVAPLPAADMARLHSLIGALGRPTPFAQANYDREELAALGAELAGIASGEVSAAPVSCGIGQVVLRRVS